MGTKSWKEIKARSRHKLTAAEEREDAVWVRRELAEMSLREVRELAGKTQTEVAEELEKTQSQLSKLERQDDALLSTLREYMRALGGELELVAVLGDKRLKLRGI